MVRVFMVLLVGLGCFRLFFEIVLDSFGLCENVPVVLGC